MHTGTYTFIEKEIEAVKKQVKEKIYTPVCPLYIEGYLSQEPLAFHQRTQGEKRIFTVGDTWGELFGCAWFRFTAHLAEYDPATPLYAYIDLSGEGLVVDAAGAPVCGLTTYASMFDFKMGMPEKCICPIEVSQNGEVEFWVDAGCNDLLGNLVGSGKIVRAEVVRENSTLRALYYDMEVLQDLMCALPPERSRKYSILHALHHAVCAMYDITEEEAAAAREILRPELEKKGGDASLYVSALGHAHIDLAWLWPIRETRRKAARTFATAVANMEKYPNYKFIQSQPQAYAWVKEDHPALYARIKEMVGARRWEAEGAMWVEADTNLSGGEALIRQFLYGKQFFKQEFGHDCCILWLPDVFGYSGALPQIMKKCGVEYFMTIKLSWNYVNQFPHHTFRWIGIDGSEVLAHMPPEGNYLSSALPHAVLDGEKAFREKGVSDRFLLPYGIGDGGGGPGEEHLERLEREKNLEGSLPVTQMFAGEFFERVSAVQQILPAWKGELYLERHRGTYTTQARSKRYNRKGEVAFRQTEYLCAMAMTLCGASYPFEELETFWKEFLLYQFHDILPGTSIDRVYEESIPRYEKILNGLKQHRESALEALGKVFGACGQRLAINTLSIPRRLEDGTTVAPFGMAPILGHAAPQIFVSAQRLEDEMLLAEFGLDGSLTRLYDKRAGREALLQCSNLFALYVDNDNAWEPPVVYRSRPPRMAVLEYTRAETNALVQQYRIGNSGIYQTITLENGQLRFDTTVDWHEQHKMLRVSFAPAVIADQAVCDIQFGSIRRSTRKNTAVDEQMIEVCAHKWLDLSDGEYGVALLNDCKYGHCIHGGSLDLCLLRATTHPAKCADQGRHQFTYALYPHKGDYVCGGVVEKGYLLNVPVEFAQGGAVSPLPFPEFLRLDGEHVMVEAVKAAQDGNGIIVRLYEYAGQPTKARLASACYSHTTLCNMLEQDIGPCGVLEFHPFEVHTVRLH